MGGGEIWPGVYGCTQADTVPAFGSQSSFPTLLSLCPFTVSREIRGGKTVGKN